MTDFVLDASVTLAWCFEDEETAQTRDLLYRMPRYTAIVPAIWPLEIANVLLIGERRQRLSQAHAAQFLQLLQSFAITVDPAPSSLALGGILALGRAYGLSAYDASYLELAMREHLPLATLDARLESAAAQIGVSRFLREGQTAR